jgi:pyridoxal phosphate enzyme (YggS family)
VNGAGPLPDPAMVQRIAERAATLRARFAELSDREVRLVAVTKGHPVEVAAAAHAAGCVDLGESYAQELVPKADALGAAAREPGGTGPVWHFVGRLQRNKVRSLVGVVSWWHTIDRPSLADEVARRAPGARVLVQLDLAGLPDRGGCAPSDAPALVQHCRDLGLEVRGLMGVGVPGPPEQARPGFRLLASMADDLGVPERSMGMSADVEVAVEEGATIVRIGTALVGPRD